MSRKKMDLNSWQMGKVFWFDEKSGEGMVVSDQGESLYVHYSAIQSDQKRKKLKANKNVKFVVFEDVSFKQIVKIQEL